jgi:hypothetical protein
VTIIESIRGEYERYQKLAESRLAQVEEAQLSAAPSAESNSIAMILLACLGKLKIRFRISSTDRRREAVAQLG